MAFFFAVCCARFRAMIFWHMLRETIRNKGCAIFPNKPSAILGKNNFLFCLSLLFIVIGLDQIFVFQNYQNWRQSTEEKEIKEERMTRRIIKLEIF